MTKRKIVLMYDEDTAEISDSEGCPIAYWSFAKAPYLGDEPSNQTGTLDKLTKLRSMNLSVDDIRDLKDMGLLD